MHSPFHTLNCIFAHAEWKARMEKRRAKNYELEETKTVYIKWARNMKSQANERIFQSICNMEERHFSERDDATKKLTWQTIFSVFCVTFYNIFVWAREPENLINKHKREKFIFLCALHALGFLFMMRAVVWIFHKTLSRNRFFFLRFVRRIPQKCTIYGMRVWVCITYFMIVVCLRLFSTRIVISHVKVFCVLSLHSRKKVGASIHTYGTEPHTLRGITFWKISSVDLHVLFSTSSSFPNKVNGKIIYGKIEKTYLVLC